MSYKKNLLVLSVSVFILYSLVVGLHSPILAENGSENSLPLSVAIDGKIIVFPDAKPFIDEASRVLVPVRFVAENMGAVVDWDGDNYIVKVNRDSKEISLKIGEKSALVNDNGSFSNIEFDTKAVIIEERTFIPIRFVSEVFGEEVDWDNESRMVKITLRNVGGGATLLPTSPTPSVSPSVSPTPSSSLSPTPSLSPSTAPSPSPSLKPVSSNFDFDEHPLIAQLSKIKWLGLGEKRDDGTYTLGFYRPWDSSKVMQLLYVPSTNMFSIGLYWVSADTLAMVKEALNIARPEIAEQVYQLIKERVGGKGSFAFEYLGDYTVSIVHVSAFDYPRDEQGVTVVIRGGN